MQCWKIGNKPLVLKAFTPRSHTQIFRKIHNRFNHNATYFETSAASCEMKKARVPFVNLNELDGLMANLYTEEYGNFSSECLYGCGNLCTNPYISIGFSRY